MSNEAVICTIVPQDTKVAPSGVNEKPDNGEGTDVGGLGESPICALKDDVVLTGSMSVNPVCVSDLVDILDLSGKSGSF